MRGDVQGRSRPQDETARAVQRPGYMVIGEALHSGYVDGWWTRQPVSSDDGSTTMTSSIPAAVRDPRPLT